MSSRLPLVISLLSAAVLFGATAIVFVLVVVSIVTGEAVHFEGSHSSAEAAAAAFGAAAQR